ncbi:MAG: glycerophosphodiester phosphodiesterase family protein [Christensenellales bacterium]
MDIKKSGLFTRPIAHRGLHDELTPENSLSAFSRAVKAGFPIELDVRPIDDGSVVVFHDDSIKRMTNRDGYVCKLSKADLDEIRLAARTNVYPILPRSSNSWTVAFLFLSKSKFQLEQERRTRTSRSRFVAPIRRRIRGSVV